MSDQSKEQIKFNTETLKLLVLLFIATSGGSLALIADGIEAAREVVLSVLGMIFSIGIGIISSNNLQEHSKFTEMNEIISYIVIGGIFLAGMIPVVAGILHYSKENKALGDKRHKSDPSLIEHS